MGSEAESNRKKSDQRLQGGAVFFFSLLSVGHERRKKKASPLRFGREYASMGGAWWGEGCILYVQEKLIPALEEQNKHLRIKNR